MDLAGRATETVSGQFPDDSGTLVEPDRAEVAATVVKVVTAGTAAQGITIGVDMYIGCAHIYSEGVPVYFCPVFAAQKRFRL